ncbi:MAG: tripartite tricarboxylate transporter permease [Planctomycetota bacterium]|nr:tripartite tricarboxylate transporter permease [Planctomycetota bacterium]
MLDMLYELTFVSPVNLLWVLLGTALGIAVGAIPGLTGAMLIALALPLTYAMQPGEAMVLLVSMYVGSISGGLITATLLRMPGTPASVITTLDGYPLAQAGKPGRALGLGIMASFSGGMISWMFLLMLARPISVISTRLSSFDYFALVLVALVLIASVSGKSLLRGLFSGMLGMLVTIPGQSPATGETRWTFGLEQLNGGFALLPVLIGMFAVSQIIHESGKHKMAVSTSDAKTEGVLLDFADWRKYMWNMCRSSVIGTWVGILPGVGANVGSVMAYSAAKGLSKNPERFGHGAEDGIVASEAANNATIGGALIPLVAMGIPGSVIDAILLGALVLHGLQPGALLFENDPDIVYTIILTMLLANVVMFVLMVGTARWIANLAVIPRHLLLPVVMAFCVVGSFALNNRLCDVWIMLGFGVVGFILERYRVPLAPFVIGFVLAPIAEEKLGSALQASGGSYLPLISGPISLTLLIIAVGLVIWPIVRRFRQSQGNSVSHSFADTSLPNQPTDTTSKVLDENDPDTEVLN